MKFKYILLIFTLALPAAAEFVFGLYPSNEPSVMYEAFIPFTTYLSIATGDDYKLIVTADYEDLYSRLADGRVDVAWINPNGYVSMTAALEGIQYITTLRQGSSGGEQDTSYYTSLILTQKESGINSLEELRGRSFAFTHTSSTSGYRIPSRLFEEMGLVPETWFSKVFFLGKHDRVIEALDAGAVDGGVVWSGAWEKAVQGGGDRFNVILRSDPIPLDPIIASASVPSDQAERLRWVLESLEPEHPVLVHIREILGWRINGFETHSDSFYDPLRRVLAREERE